MPDAIETQIQAALDAIEREDGARVLYACESGSRAWGFASTDSDYDVRFIYARPREAYLRLDAPRDVIERLIVGDLDVNGWDVFKALRLLRKSNPPLMEWLLSPIVYREVSPAIAALREAAGRCYSPLAMFAHYRSMAVGNHHAGIEGRAEVSRKKYLYVLRPLAAMLYLEQRRAVPPTSFATTLAGVTLPDDVRERIGQLVADKMAGVELGKAPPDALLDAFIAGRLAAWQEAPVAMRERGRWDTGELDAILAGILREADTQA